jgi:hypothetical protein
MEYCGVPLGTMEYCGVPLGTMEYIQYSLVATYRTGLGSSATPVSLRAVSAAWSAAPCDCMFARCPLHVVGCTLHVASCTCSVACYPLHVVCCMSHVVCCTLHARLWCVANCTVCVAQCTLYGSRMLHAAHGVSHGARCMVPRMLHPAHCTTHAASRLLRVACRFSQQWACRGREACTCCATPIVGRSSRRGVLSLERAAHARTCERAGATSAHVRCIAECSTQKCTIAPMRSEADMCVRNHYLADARTHGHTHICARTHACTHARPHVRAHACTHAHTWRTTRTQRLLLGSCGVQTLHAAAQGMREEVRAEVTLK